MLELTRDLRESFDRYFEWMLENYRDGTEAVKQGLLMLQAVQFRIEQRLPIDDFADQPQVRIGFFMEQVCLPYQEGTEEVSRILSQLDELCKAYVDYFASQGFDREVLTETGFREAREEALRLVEESKAQG